MKMRWPGFLLVILGLAMLLTSCAGPGDSPSGMEQQHVYEVTDDQGYSLKFSGKPQRIVSLSIGTDELVADLVPPERIAALTYHVDDPGVSNVVDKAKGVAARVRANPEQVIALQPDLLIVPDWQPRELVAALREAGVPVYVYREPATVVGVKENIAKIALAVGEAEAGRKLVAWMDDELAAVAGQVKAVEPERRQTVLRFSLLGADGGQGSLFDDFCRYAGVVNAAATAGLAQYDILSREKIVEVNPDVFIMPMWDYSGKTDMAQFRESVRSDPALQTIKAVQNDRLVMSPDKYQNCSSHYVVYGVKDIARAAYPGLNWQ